jgi:hypothetical protein
MEKMTQFVPTHRHYKGGFYRVLERDYVVRGLFVSGGATIDWNGFEATATDDFGIAEPGVIYQHRSGRVYYRPQDMFDGLVDGSPRFRALSQGESS